MDRARVSQLGLPAVCELQDNRCTLGKSLDNQQDSKNPLAQQLAAADQKEISTFSWPNLARTKDGEAVWVSRLRSGYTSSERKAARWTNDASFRYTDCTHDRLLSTSPETYFHKGKPFREGSADILVVDSGTEQSFDRFLEKIISSMGVELGNPGNSATVEIPARTLNDKPLYLARQFFRENV